MEHEEGGHNSKVFPGGAVHWCVGATLLMLAALAFVTPAQALAQTSDVLLSNLGRIHIRPAGP